MIIMKMKIILLIMKWNNESNERNEIICNNI